MRAAARAIASMAAASSGLIVEEPLRDAAGRGASAGLGEPFVDSCEAICRARLSSFSRPAAVSGLFMSFAPSEDGIIP